MKDEKQEFPQTVYVQIDPEDGALEYENSTDRLASGEPVAVYELKYVGKVEIKVVKDPLDNS